MKKYKLKIEPEALADIQEITNWYDEQQKDLAEGFRKQRLNTLTPFPGILKFMPFVTTKSVV